MNKIFIVPLLLALCYLPCKAQESKQTKACFDKARTQTAIDACANQEAERVDQAMNAVYRKVVARAAGQPQAVAKVRAAQTAWLAYRKAYLNAMYPAEDKQAQYGTMFPMEADLRYADLTRSHIADLEQLLKQYSN